MRVLIWLFEETWEACIDASRALLPDDAEITLLHVVSADVVAAPGAALGGLLGRAKPHRDPVQRMAVASEEAAATLLAAAQDRLGRPASLAARFGRVEHEVVATAAATDLLVAARDGDRSRPGPRSLGPATRFVVDHAPCQVLLVWARGAPVATSTPTPPPEHSPPRRP